MDSGEDSLLKQDDNQQIDKHPFGPQLSRRSTSPIKIITASSGFKDVYEENNVSNVNMSLVNENPEDYLMRTLKKGNDSRSRIKKANGRIEDNNNLGSNLNGTDELFTISMTSLYDRDFNEMDTDRKISVKGTEIVNINSDEFRLSTISTEENEPLAMELGPDKIGPKTNPLPYHLNNNINDNKSIIDDDGVPNPFGENPTLSNSLYMSDGIRSVDYVLAWEYNENQLIELSNANKRQVYEENLINQGLEIEREQIEHDLHFVKIHAPLDVLRRYAEILKLRMPMKESLCKIHRNERMSTFNHAAQYISEKIPGLSGVRNTTNNLYSQLKGFGSSILRYILVDEQHFPRRSQRFTAIYSRDKEYLFDLQQESFFTAAVRSRIVQFIIDRQKFSSGNDDFAFGIERLVSVGVYLAGYPLHDGELSEPGSMRYKLYNEWAAVRKWYRYQPLDYIKEYFGVKIGLYFAWLGFYTYMLLLASIVGILCFLYSWLSLDKNIPTNQICSGEAQFKMCPLCDNWCDYWDLKETCFYSRITYLIDNPSTVFFAIFMSFWATLFLELWKRYSAEITHRWDLTGFDVHEEHPRPQYLARLAHVRKMRIDYVTNQKEPQPPFWRMKLPATVFSFSIVILLIMLAFAAVVAVVIYRMSILAALTVYGPHVNTSSAIMITTGTAACMNLCIIFIFNYMYTYLAQYLTELELLRTQTEFDDSLTLKIYMLQFVNYYASIFYIAFFKGKFVGHPGKYNRFFEFRQEECSSGGCLTELCIQLAIIMIGKQAMNSILEMLMPIFWKWVNVMKVGLLNRSRNRSKKKHKGERWLRDLKLVEWGPRSLFPEYLEMILQYGFVTIFVSAFPLAPFFALLNNILEMRLDAKKLLTYYRRPVSQRVKDIGVWYRILDSIGKLSVITNGFIIAFTSDFIPRLVFLYTESTDGTMSKYLEYSLATFNTTELQQPPRNSSHVVDICRYADFRSPHTASSTQRYRLTGEYYVILACRLAFVVLFENFVALVMILVRWCIPDMSSELRDQIRREAYITNEIIIKQETLRARAERAERECSDSVSIEPNMNFIKMEKLMSGNLSQSELDLVMHGPEELTVHGHYPQPGQQNANITIDTADSGPISV